MEEGRSLESQTTDHICRFTKTTWACKLNLSFLLSNAIPFTGSILGSGAVRQRVDPLPRIAAADRLRAMPQRWTAPPKLSPCASDQHVGFALSCSWLAGIPQVCCSVTVITKLGGWRKEMEEGGGRRRTPQSLSLCLHETLVRRSMPVLCPTRCSVCCPEALVRPILVRSCRRPRSQKRRPQVLTQTQMQTQTHERTQTQMQMQAVGQNSVHTKSKLMGVPRSHGDRLPFARGPHND